MRSKHENALPLMITHGWPGSVMEFMKVIGPLTDPTAHGGQAEDAFHVVAPSLPGYGFSDKPTASGWGVPKIAEAWIKLMRAARLRPLGRAGRRLGRGGDHRDRRHPPAGCAAIHVNMPLVFPEPDQLQDLDRDRAGRLAALAYYQDKDSGYSKQQSTRPQTLGYGLVDSPAGQAAWIYEKMWAWTDNRARPRTC